MTIESVAVASIDSSMAALEALNEAVVDCRRCPRLVEWREQVAREKRAAFRDWDYWGRPMQGFGDPAARVLILGLAPAAHGGNRTGPDLHRRPLGRLPVRVAAPGRAGQPGRVGLARRRAAAGRRVHRRRGALRAAREPADAGGACELRRLARARGRAAAGRPRGRVPRRLRVGERAAAARGAGRRAGAAAEAEVRPRRASPTASRGRCSAAFTRASRTRSRAS